MINYFKLALLVMFLIALGAENFWVFNKGKDSVIKNVIAGVATTSKQEEKAADKAVQLATVEAVKQETIKTETKVRHDKLQASVQATPRSDCVLLPDELSSLQAAARATQP